MRDFIVDLPRFVVLLIFLAGIVMGFCALFIAESYPAAIAWVVGGLAAVLVCLFWCVAHTLPPFPGPGD